VNSNHQGLEKGELIMHQKLGICVSSKKYIHHILKSIPDQETRLLIDTISKEEETREVRLYEGQLDYRELVT